MWKFFKPIGTARDCEGTVLGVCFIIYEINCVLVNRRPEMSMEFGSIKRNRRLASRLSTDNPLFYFWDY